MEELFSKVAEVILQLKSFLFLKWPKSFFSDLKTRARSGGEYDKAHR